MPTRYSQTRQALHMTMDSHTQYELFKKYLLTDYELKRNDFPRASCRPGKIIIADESVFHRGTNRRRCTRCKQFYDNNYNPANSRGMPCYYHPKKGDVASGTYPCCQRAYMSPGCTKGKYHVSTECDLTEVVFKKTRPGRSKFACNVFALDCEMVYTKGGMELAKVCIVGVDGTTIYESFVVPEKEILDYNTEYSGVTSKDLVANAMSFSEAQEIVLGFVTQDSILVGHGLENDLRALRLIHGKIVDTSVLFPHERAKYKRSLKSLAMEFLNKDIQKAASGHDCTEDAQTAMELVLYKINLDLFSANSARFPVAQSVKDLSQVNTPRLAQSCSKLNSHPSSTSDLRHTTTQTQKFFVPDLNSSRTKLIGSQQGPNHAWSGTLWRPAYTNVDAETRSHNRGGRDPRTFVQDENNGNLVNTSFVPEQSRLPERMDKQLRDRYSEEHAWLNASEVPEDVFYRSISYMQQHLFQRNQMHNRSLPMGDIHAPNLSTMGPVTIPGRCHPNVFGVVHRGEWYPVPYFNNFLNSYGHVEA